MANIDERVRKLELIFATLAGGAAVLVAVVLGLFGFTTVYQIPHEVEQEIPAAVANEIEKKYPNIEKELERKMVELAESERRARAAAQHLEQLAATHGQALASLKTAIEMDRFHDFGSIDCGTENTLLVPEGTTEEWVLFSVNPQMSAETVSHSGNNALYSIETTVIPQADEKSWSVTFFAEINFDTNSEGERDTSAKCDWDKLKSTPKARILAIRTT